MLDHLPTEILEHIGQSLLSIVDQDSPPEDEVTPSVLKLQAVHPLTLVNVRFNAIFTPLLYQQMVLQTEHSRASFLLHTAKNRQLCSLVATLIYSQQKDESRTHHTSSRPSEFVTVLLNLPRLRTLKIWKVNCWQQWWDAPKKTDSVGLTSLTDLRTIEFLQPKTLHHVANSLYHILPQIECLTIKSCIPLPLYGSGVASILRLLTNLRSLRIHGIRFGFEMLAESMVSGLCTDHLEEIELDSTIPSPGFPFFELFTMTAGTLDRCKESLKLFRYRGDPLEAGLQKYLDHVLENCDVVDITEIPLEHGEGIS